MFWADALLKERTGKEWVNDAWTPSGIIHMGGIKGPIIHDVLYKIIKQQDRNAKYTYGFDDMDPIDGLPKELQKSHGKYMGIPIFQAPSPDGEGSFGDYYSNMMRDLFKKLGIEAEIYLAHDYYQKGIYNKAIGYILDHASDVRKVYSDMYKKQIPDTWFPLQVICPKCGKLGTTKVTEWDGKEVIFSCEPEMVKWARGCGFKGRISPFDGNAKLSWKVEWGAKWWTFGVTIEGAGKDHASAGGSYDIAMKVCSEVFHAKPPLKLAYEFFLWNGKKMSSSKGIGLTSQQLLEVISPQMARFLMIKTEPNKAVEFNPVGTLIIPKLYDDYQQASMAPHGSHRAFELSQIGKEEKVSKVRFLTLAQWVQMPNMESEIKKEGLEEWAKYAKVWVEKYAPESEKFTVQKELPKEVKNLSKEQKHYLKLIADRIDKSFSEVELGTNLYKWIQESMLRSNEAFAAIYIALLGKDHGPKAASLIRSLDKEFVKKRFQEVHSNDTYHHSESAKIASLNKPELFSIDKTLKEKYPSISIGIAVIKSVSIKKSDERLEKGKTTLLRSLEGLTTEQLGTYPEILAYRKLYKAMGIDWHSRRPSPEALLRRVALKKGLYTVNTCVDAYNLVVMKHRVSVGAFDYDKIVFPTVLRFAKEGEEILLLGDSEPTKYKEGEIAYFDKTGGFNMDFNYRDAQRTAVQLETKNLYINVDGVFDISPQKVEEVLKETCDMITKYCGGKVEEFGVETS